MVPPQPLVETDSRLIGCSKANMMKGVCGQRKVYCIYAVACILNQMIESPRTSRSHSPGLLGTAVALNEGESSEPGDNGRRQP